MYVFIDTGKFLTFGYNLVSFPLPSLVFHEIFPACPFNGRQDVNKLSVFHPQTAYTQQLPEITSTVQGTNILLKKSLAKKSDVSYQAIILIPPPPWLQGEGAPRQLVNYFEFILFAKLLIFSFIC